MNRVFQPNITFDNLMIDYHFWTACSLLGRLDIFHKKFSGKILAHRRVEVNKATKQNEKGFNNRHNVLHEM